MPLLERHAKMVPDNSKSPDLSQLQQDLSGCLLSTPKSSSSSLASSGSFRSRLLSSGGKLRPRALYRELTAGTPKSSINNCSPKKQENNSNQKSTSEHRKMYMQQKFKERRQLRDENRINQLFNGTVLMR